MTTPSTSLMRQADPTRYGLKLPQVGVDRLTGGRDPSPWRRPLLLLLALLLAGLLLLGYHLSTRVTDVPQGRLSGPRGPACLRLVIGADVSGSMDSLTKPRDAAVDQLLKWVPHNLRPDDQISLIAFATTAVTTIAPTPVGKATLHSGSPEQGNDTLFQPVLHTISQYPRTRCRTVLLLISDALLTDLPSTPDEANRQLAAAGIDQIDLIVPGHTTINPAWEDLYPTAPPDTFNGNNADKTALTIANHIASYTGQKLTRA